jgi:choice-of-anchor C domain-containing protein
MRKSIFAMAGAMHLTAALAAPALAADFANGSFENGADIPPVGYKANATSADIDAWDVLAPVDYVNDAYWDAAAGFRSIDMMGSPGKGKISQTFNTTDGKTYMVTFMMANNPITNAGANCDATVPSSLTASAAGVSSLFSTTPGNAIRDMKYEEKGLSCVASGNSTTLTFESSAGGYCGAALDKVMVWQVAPTGADCKKDGWKTMTDSTGASFRNQGDWVSFYATGEKNLANPQDDA